ADSSYVGFDGWALTLADIDGDGMPDLITSSSQTLSIFKNISTPGNIRFSEAFSTSSPVAFASGLEAGDVDNDGRTDLIFINGARSLTVVRNISTPDSIKFDDAKTILPPPSYVGDNLRLKIADFDGDGRVDAAMVYTYVDSVVIVHNNSTPGDVEFDQ